MSGKIRNESTVVFPMAFSLLYSLSFNILRTMRSCYPLLLVCLFSAQIVRGQGTMLFTWHGDSNFFQASFEATQVDLQPGSKLSDSPLFLSTLSITNPDGGMYHYVAGS